MLSVDDPSPGPTGRGRRVERPNPGCTTRLVVGLGQLRDLVQTLDTSIHIYLKGDGLVPGLLLLGRFSSWLELSAPLSQPL